MGDMSSLERVVAAIKHEPSDRVPAIAVSITRSLQEAGYRVQDAVYNPVMMAEAKILAHEHFGDDGVIAGTDLFVESEAMGSRTQIYEHVPVVVDYAIKSKSDLDGIRPAVPATDGRMPIVVEEIKLLKKRLGDTVVVGPVTCGPVTMASQLCGPEQLLMAMIEDPRWVHRLMEVCTEMSLRYWSSIADAGAHAIVLLEPMTASTIMGPDQYEEFAVPYIKRIFDLAHSKGVVPVNHVCADSSLIWKQMVAVGAPMIMVDYPVSLAACKAQVGDLTCITGNVNPVEYMLYGTADEVYRKAVDCINQTANGSGFVLCSGCDLNPRTPSANILALVQAAKDTYFTADGKVHFHQYSYPLQTQA